MCALMSVQGESSHARANLCWQHNMDPPTALCTIRPGWQVCLAARLLLRGPPLDAAGLDAWESAAWHTRQLGTAANDLGAGATLGRVLLGAAGCMPYQGTCLVPHGRALPGMRSSMHASSAHHLTSMAECSAVTCYASRECPAGVAHVWVLRTLLQACLLAGRCVHSVVSGADAAGGRAVCKRSSSMPGLTPYNPSK